MSKRKLSKQTRLWKVLWSVRSGVWLCYALSDNNVTSKEFVLFLEETGETLHRQHIR